MAFRISTAVTTTRKLQNTETCLDILVPDFTIEEWKGKLDRFKTPKVFYHLIVISNLFSDKGFKLSKVSEESKEIATMHFTRNIEYSKFVKLRKDLDKKYSGTYVPEIENQMSFGSKIATTSKAIIKEFRERQVKLDKFMKWCASTPKIASSDILLNFIGMKNQNDKNVKEDQDKTTPTSKQVYEEMPTSDSELFDEIDYSVTEDLLFQQVSKQDFLTNKFEKDQNEENSSALFAKPLTSKTVGLFEKDDLTGNVLADDNELIVLNEEDDDTILSQKLSKKSDLLKNKVVSDEDEVGYDDDLLNIQEDISSIASQIKSVRIKPSPLQHETKHFNKETPTLAASVDVESLKDIDLMAYINKKSDDEEDEDVDLGF